MVSKRLGVQFWLTLKLANQTLRWTLIGRWVKGAACSNLGVFLIVPLYRRCSFSPPWSLTTTRRLHPPRAPPFNAVEFGLQCILRNAGVGMGFYLCTPITGLHSIALLQVLVSPFFQLIMLHKWLNFCPIRFCAELTVIHWFYCSFNCEHIHCLHLCQKSTAAFSSINSIHLWLVYLWY